MPKTEDDPFTRLDGAVIGSGYDAGVPAHYGNPLGEQRSLIERGAVMDLSHRGVLSLEDAPAAPADSRLRRLERLGTQRLNGVAVGDSVETLLLSSGGRIRHVLHVVDDGSVTWIVVENGEAADVRESLRHAGVVVRDRGADVAVVGTRTAAMPESERGGVPLVWRDPWCRVTDGGRQYARAAEHPATEWRWHEAIVPRESLAQVVERVGANVAGTLAWDALRVEAWRPRLATEVDENSMPQELDWTRTAVDHGKREYPGSAALLAAAPRLPDRRLVMLYLDGSESVLPRHGAPVWLDAGGERLVVGAVTTGAMHYELGPVALAVIERAVGVGEPLNVDEADIVIPASQEEIVAA